MQLTSVVCAIILAATAVQATPTPWCGSHGHEMPCGRDLADNTVAKRAPLASNAEWQARSAELVEIAEIAKREAESSPEALAHAWCGSHGHEMPCGKRAAEAIAEAHAEAEANPQPLPDAEAFAEAWCGSHGHEMPCGKKRAAEAVPEAWCGSHGHEMPCGKKREAILRREYTAALALRDL